MYMMLCMFGLMAGCENQYDTPPAPEQVQEQRQLEAPVVDETTLLVKPRELP